MARGRKHGKKKEKTEMATTTFKFDETTEKTILRLKAAYGATSKAEVVRIALALLDTARRAARQNRRIAIVDEDTTSEGISPILMPGAACEEDE